MNSKTILIGLLLALIAAGGVFLGQRSSSEKTGAESKQSTPSETSKKEGPQLKAASTGDDPSKKSPEGTTSSSPGTAPTGQDENTAPTKKKMYNKDPYWNKIKADPQVARLFKKTQKFFKNSPEAEDFAVWISAGFVMDENPEYGALIGKALKEIDQNKEENFNHLKETLKGFSPEDSFIRGMAINLVNQMSLSGEDKVSFFGNESARKVLLDKQGRFSPDSLNITTSMIFMKQNIKSESEALSYATESLKKNTDPAIRKKLISRFVTYFPEIEKDLESYK